MIAISYRREDSLPIAGRLFDRLQAKFGKKNVFMDFDSIPPGMDFREQIKQMIERSKLVIAIIGPHWLGEQPDASRRIDNPADFVRLEIAYALQRGIPVIPVLVNNALMPPPERLPQEIGGLAFRNALVLDTGIDFHHHADRLITGIGKVIDIAPRLRGPQKVLKPTASPANRRPLRNIVTRSAAILLVVGLLALAVRYIAIYKPQPAKQVATANNSSGPSAESATSPPLSVKPAEPSSPLPLASMQPKSIIEQGSHPENTETLTLSVGSAVNSVAFSPDGTRIVTGSHDPTAKVWDAQTGNELLTLKGHSSSVNSVAFSPDGKRIAIGSAAGVDATAKVSDAHSGKELLMLPWAGQVNSVAFSPDGKRIASGTDHTAQMWDAQSGKKLLTLSLRGQVNSVAFSPDGRRIVTGSTDETAKVWDAQNGEELLTLKGHSYSVNSVAFSPDGRRIVTGSTDETAKVWDAQNGEELLTLNFGGQVNSVAFSPDGRCVVAGGDHATAKVWDAQSGKELLTLKGHSSSVNAVAFSPDGTRIATGSLDTTTKVWAFSDRKDEKSTAPLGSTPGYIKGSREQRPLSPTATPNDAGAQRLTKAFVKKYAFSVLLPTELFPDAAAKLADANTDRLVSVNGCFTVAFSVLSSPLKKAYDNCIAEFRKKANHITIDYKVLKKTWFVVSGDSDTHYYTKGVKRGDNVIVMALEYTGSCNDIADAMLTEISRKFDGN